jgi:hypothetical protein
MKASVGAMSRTAMDSTKGSVKVQVKCSSKSCSERCGDK